MSNRNNFSPDYYDLPSTDHISRLIMTNSHSRETTILENKPGKQASVKILFNIANSNNMHISAGEAQHGLLLFGDYVLEETQQPGAHPNIRLLMDIVENKEAWSVTVE